MSKTPAIELTGATKRFRTPSGALHTAVRDLDLTVAQGEFVAVVGPTGCGKSTTLTLVSGLEEPTEGEVRVYGEPVRGIHPRVGFVFQQDAVFPWRTVLSNVMAGPRFRGVPTAEAKERARDWLGRVGLGAFEDRYPHQLSGGMRKRVALAQTFVNDPDILLMDEPFSALDVQTRALMSDQLLELWAGTRSSSNAASGNAASGNAASGNAASGNAASGNAAFSKAASVVFVTHDLDEAIALADRVVVMTAGPATVKEVFTVDLPRPRTVEAVRLEPRFVELYREIWASLGEEVRITRERGADRAA